MKQKDYDKEIAELKAKIIELEKVKVAEKKNNPFDVGNGDAAYYNDSTYIASCYDHWCEYDLDKHIPCKDKSIVIARQKRHKLNDLLEKFAYDNDAVVTEDMWKDVNTDKYCIDVKTKEIDINKKYEVFWCCDAIHIGTTTFTLGTIAFSKEKVAQRAIKEVVIPLMEGRL